MTLNRALFIACLVIAGSSCTSRKYNSGWMLIRMERTPCYGTCPIYTFELSNEGQASFNGRRFTDKLGVWQKSFTDTELAPLRDFMRTVDIRDFDTLYPTHYSDLPGHILEISTQKRKHRIEIYGEHPAPLDSLVSYLTTLAESGEWENMNTE